MNKALRYFHRLMFGRQAKRWLLANLERLAFYCQPPDPAALRATDLDQATKYRTWWPSEDFLERIKHDVMSLATTERKHPARRPWEMFELIDRRQRTLHLIKNISELAERARERFTEANFSDLEALSYERRENKDAQNLLRDIDRIKQDVGAAKTIVWAQYKGILARFSDDGYFERASDTALTCYARVLEMMIDNRRWEKLREDSEPLVSWLLEIGYPGAAGKDGLEPFNFAASLRWYLAQGAKIQRERAAKLAKFQQSGRVIKKDKDDIEDDRLMNLVRRGEAKALEQLRERHQGLVESKVKEILRGNPAVEDIAPTSQL